MYLADDGSRLFDTAGGFGLFFHDGAGDDEALDLTGPLVDLGYPCVPVVPLDRMVFHVSPAAEDLNRLVGYLVRHLRGVELGAGSRLCVALPTVLHPGRLVDEQTGRPDPGLHICQLEGYRLVFGDRLPE